MPKTAGPNEVLVRYNSQGQVNCYQVYGADGLPIKRVDVRGKPHNGVPTPHVVEFTRKTNPRTGRIYVTKLDGDPRAALPEEAYGL